MGNIENVDQREKHVVVFSTNLDNDDTELGENVGKLIEGILCDLKKCWKFNNKVVFRTLQDLEEHMKKTFSELEFEKECLLLILTHGFTGSGSLQPQKYTPGEELSIRFEEKHAENEPCASKILNPSANEALSGKLRIDAQKFIEGGEEKFISSFASNRSFCGLKKLIMEKCKYYVIFCQCYGSLYAKEICKILKDDPVKNQLKFMGLSEKPTNWDIDEKSNYYLKEFRAAVQEGKIENFLV